MTKPPIDLDSHRDAAGVMGAEMRRSVSIPSMERRDAALHDMAAIEQRLDAPVARTLVEAAELAIFLLGTYAAMMEARDPRCAALIARAISQLQGFGSPPAAPDAEETSS